MKKHLLIGTLPPPLGGTTVSFAELVRGLTQEPEIFIEVIKTNGIRNKNVFKSLFTIGKLIYTFISKVHKVDSVSLHLSYKAHSIFSPIVLLLAKILKKKVIVRRFGGVLHSEMNFINKFLLDQICKFSDCYLVETLRQKKELENFNNVIYYPTGRRKSDYISFLKYPTQLEHIVFISQVKKTKGIFELIESVRRTPQLSLTIYGPLFDGIVPADLDVNSKISYGGVLEHNDVMKVIAKSDCVALPTYYPGEGYPGIIFEAIHCGKPVLISQWKALPDLVDGCSGVIVQPESIDSILDGFKRMEKIIKSKDYIYDIKKLSQKFDSDELTKKFIKLI